MITKKYEDLDPMIQAYPAEKMRPLHMPVEEFIHACRDLYHWALEDQQDLATAGMSPEILGDLKLRTDALAEWEGKWNRDRSAMLAAQKLWSEKRPQAIYLRKQLFHAFAFALRHPDNQRQREALDRIREGRGSADLIQDLRELAILGESIPDQLRAINFDLTMLATARQMHEELSELNARANGEDMKNDKVKDMRDKAYCYLRDGADEVIAFGKYVFWENQDRLAGYRSIY